MTVWRLLDGEGVGAAEGLAFDEAMMLRHGRGEQSAAPASIRLYTYRAHCALVGRYQSLEDEVDRLYCAAHGIETGRRPTGGGAIIMGPGQLGIAVTARARAEETPREALRRYAEGVIAGLEELGIAAEFRAKNDLEVDGRKIAGLGLYLDPRGAILFHSSVLADLDIDLMLKVLRIPGAKYSDKAAARIEDRVTTISRELGRSWQATAVREAFAAGFGRRFGVGLEPGELDEEETELGRRLVRERYGSRQWIRQRSPRPDARGSAMLKTPDGLLRFFVGVHGSTIKSVLVTGDFNVLPAGLARLEAALKWTRIDREILAARALEALNAQELGVEPDAVAAAIWQAATQALELEQGSHPERPSGSCYVPEAPVGKRSNPSEEI
jgi:lipoate-protein ligase A